MRSSNDNDKSETLGQASAAIRCPVCRKPEDQSYRPFCSKRCADIDLGRWVTGSYVIAGGSDDAAEEAANEPSIDGKNGAENT